MSRYAKRVLLFAIGFQAVKYLLIFTATLANEFIAMLFVIFIYITMLPELMIGPHSGYPSKLVMITRVLVGILWNALLIHLLVIFVQNVKLHKN